MADSSDTIKQDFPVIDGEENAVVATKQATDKSSITDSLQAADPDHDDLQISDIVRTATEPDEEFLKRLDLVKAARNPLYEAAKPLLLTLAKLPKTQLEGRVQVDAFRQLLEREVVNFQSLCNRANIVREHVTTGSYCLCTALDEAANSTLWGGGEKHEIGPWAGDMLAKTFHDDTEGGAKFFLLAGRLSTQPEQHRDLLEVMYYILSLGFEGKFSHAENGLQHVETIRQRLYTLFMTGREPVARELSAHWQGAGVGKFKMLRSIPVWVTVSVLGMAFLVMFSWHKYQLTTQADRLAEEISAIGKMTPPPVQGVPLKLAQLLKDEIARGLVSVTENATHSIVMFKGDDMFVAGQAQLNQKMLPLLDKVAAEIARVSGNVQVIGHSDNIPINTRQFLNNQVLSEERAANVGDVLQAAGIAANRLEIVGRGDSVPLTSNATATGRAKNRRVEMIVSGDRS